MRIRSVSNRNSASRMNVNSSASSGSRSGGSAGSSGRGRPPDRAGTSAARFHDGVEVIAPDCRGSGLAGPASAPPPSAETA
jgi:hypothetical protein